MKYTVQKATKNASKVKLDASAEVIEVRLEELAGITITDKMRNDAKTAAEEAGITYEEYLLEYLISGGEEMKEESRAEIQGYATALNMSYKDTILYLLNQSGNGISLFPETTEVKIGNATQQIIDSGFVATRNGTYEIVITKKDGQKLKQTI